MRRIGIIAAMIFLCTDQAAAGWKSHREKSELTDFVNIYWSLTSDNAIRNSIGVPKKAIFRIMCYQNETRVHFDFHNYMGNRDFVMSYRLDKGAVIETYVTVSDSGEVFGWWRGYVVGLDFLKSIEGGKRLVVSAAPYSKGAQEAVFSITGIKNAIESVRKACNW